MISVIMATYNRSAVIGFTIRSVLHQTRTDWELLVIGDHCSDNTEQVVCSFEDPRIRFINLEKRIGDQSGPTNFAIGQARGHYLAFLNHDDLWFPDHLERSVTHLEQTKSDLVYTLQFDVEPDIPLVTQKSAYGLRESALKSTTAGFANAPVFIQYEGVCDRRFQGTLTQPIGRFLSHERYKAIRVNSIYKENFSPFFPPNISTWTCVKTWASKQRPFRSFEEVFTYPSIDWLTYAWKQGAQLRSVPTATVLILTSLTRQASYLNKDPTEHAFWFEKIVQKSAREELLMSAFLYPKPTHLQGYDFKPLLHAIFTKILKRLLHILRCNPTAWILYLRCPKKWGIFPMRGALRRKLYRKRGLKIEEVCQ